MKNRTANGTDWLLSADFPRVLLTHAGNPVVLGVVRDINANVTGLTQPQRDMWIALATFQARHWRAKSDTYEKYIKKIWRWLSAIDDVKGKIVSNQVLRRQVYYLLADAMNPPDIEGVPKRDTLRPHRREKGTKMIDPGYDWLDANHRGRELQKALGYGKTAFTDALKKLPAARVYRRKKPKGSPKNAPSYFSHTGALWLLSRRLSAMRSDRAKNSAQPILDMQRFRVEGSPARSESELSPDRSKSELRALARLKKTLKPFTG